MSFINVYELLGSISSIISSAIDRLCIMKKTGKPNNEYGLIHLLLMKALQKAICYLRWLRLLSWKRNAVNTKFQGFSIVIIIVSFSEDDLQVCPSPTPFVSLSYTSLSYPYPSHLINLYFHMYTDHWSVDWVIYYIVPTFFI